MQTKQMLFLWGDYFHPHQGWKAASGKKMPDFNYIQKELLRNGVNKKHLWTEYLVQHNQAGEELLMYSSFAITSNRMSRKGMRLCISVKKPGEQVEFL